MMMAHGMNSVSTFYPAIVRSLGYNNTISLLLVAPPFLLACFIHFGLSYWSDVSATQSCVYP